MTNGLRPLAELCMDGCFADKAVLVNFVINGCFHSDANTAKSCMRGKRIFAAGTQANKPSGESGRSKRSQSQECGADLMAARSPL